MTVSDFVRTVNNRSGDSRKGSWGVDGYYVPINDHLYKTTEVLKWPKKSSANSYMDTIIKKSK